MFDGLENISTYNLDTDLTVNILGHIFEQSISDIEDIKSEIEGKVIENYKGKK
ncbi:hypothetical protein [Clostridium estertheticum]|uniref:hypothetical protein n=1 Tax=Clostridium estertheticum TaxID=238834 RepID=UPI001C0D742F|nr:hypothetical protein [Clostridium estertheticum]MBU3187796.1 hypothetical protein [Clostridium estertheticum]